MAGGSPSRPECGEGSLMGSSPAEQEPCTDGAGRLCSEETAAGSSWTLEFTLDEAGSRDGAEHRI